MLWSPPGKSGTPKSPLTAPERGGPPSSPPDFSSSRRKADGRGEPCAALRTTEYLDAHHGQPRPSSHQPDYTLLGTIPIRLCRDRRRTRHRPKACAKRLTLMSVRQSAGADGPSGPGRQPPPADPPPLLPLLGFFMASRVSSAG